MSPPTIRQPGDVVNEVYSHNIKTILDLCSEAGDDPTPLIEQTKTEMMAETTPYSNVNEPNSLRFAFVSNHFTTNYIRTNPVLNTEPLCLSFKLFEPTSTNIKNSKKNTKNYSNASLISDERNDNCVTN